MALSNPQNVQSENFTADSSTDTLASYNVGAGTDGRRALVVQTAIEDATSPESVTSITYGGTNLAKITDGSQAAEITEGLNRQEVWILYDDNIATGSQTEDIVVTFAGDNSRGVIIAYWLDDVDQGTNVAQVVVNSNAGATETSISATATSVAANSLLCAHGNLGDGNAMTGDGSQTTATTVTAGTSEGALAYEKPGSGTHAQGFTFASSRRPNIVLIEFAEFVAGTSVTVPAGSISLSGQVPTVTAGGAPSIAWDSLADPIYAIDSSGNCGWTFTGTYENFTPSAIQYRIMQGASEIQTWGNVDSFSGGTFSVAAPVPVGEGYTLEVRDNTATYTDTSDSFDVGPVILFTGSSSAARLFDDSSDTLTGKVHIKAGGSGGSWTTSDTVSISGEAAVACANYLDSTMGCPVGMYDYGVGGTRLLNQWLPPSGSAYTAAVAAAANGNLSCIVDIAGSNDANDGVSLTQANYENFWSNLRSDTKNVTVIKVGDQRDRRSPEDPEFVDSWVAATGAVAADGNAYYVSRIDIEIAVDDTHNTQAGMNLYAERIAAIVDYVFDDGTFYKGPSISSVVLDVAGGDIEVNLDATGTDYSTLSPSSSIAGFEIFDGGSPATISTAVTNGSSQIVLTPSSPISGQLTWAFAGTDPDFPNARPFTGYPTVNSAVNMPVTPTYSTAIADERHTPPAGSLTLTGFAPSITLAEQYNVPVGSLSLSGLAPSVQTSNNQLVTVPAGGLSFAGIVPSVSVDGPISVDIPLASLTLTGLAPTISGGAIWTEIPDVTTTWTEV